MMSGYVHPSPHGAMPPRSAYAGYTPGAPTLLSQLKGHVPEAVRSKVADLQGQMQSSGRKAGRRSLSQRFRLFLRNLISIPTLLAAVWIYTLWWGERTAIRDSVSSCLWNNWENWPSNAVPHHVVFVADPQLVDPHTYPGRPWPLSTLTVKYTDQYMRRAFSSIQKTLHPDTVFFLGDLFDGGREWATRTTTSPEARYKNYGEKFWIKEYSRFSKIFFDTWNEGGAHSPTQPYGRRLIASLPGNHDLGFGTGIQGEVRQRFQAYFGRGNRVDVVGNHSFVSVDTVSLSAMDQPDPKTGSSGHGNGDGTVSNGDIWLPTQEFLEGVRSLKGRLENESLRLMKNESEGYVYSAGPVPDYERSTLLREQDDESLGLPTLLLTHVPLYRKPATPCGPLREKYPPSTSDPYPEEDERNALKIAGGYQYQNVLTTAVSNDLITKIGSGIVQIMSGDDHDYCEILHREYSGSPREITVKSLSWAMGVRRPGFVMTSMWNPIDVDTGRALEKSDTTLQNHLCLLPDQLGIFIRYACLFGFTLFVLFLRSVAAAFRPQSAVDAEMSLPYIEPKPYPPHGNGDHERTVSTSMSSSTSTSPAERDTRISSRGATSNGGRDASNSAVEDDYDTKWKPRYKSGKIDRQSARGCVGGQHTFLGSVLFEFRRSVKHVAFMVLPCYFWLIWMW